MLYLMEIIYQLTTLSFIHIVEFLDLCFISLFDFSQIGVVLYSL